MADSSLKNQSHSTKSSLSPEKYARLKAEAKAPYRGLRKFFYLAFAASGFIGALVFLAQIAAGRDVASALPNFALQVGLVALMVFFYSRDRSGAAAPAKRDRPS
jgi:VIT1/CCC1 family predicted Fe2+/Mn2+ transporter